MRRQWLLCACAIVFSAACGPDAAEAPPDLESVDTLTDSKSDEFEAVRQFETYFTSPHCDVCTDEDKRHLLSKSAMSARIVELIDGAQRSVEIAQFTFSQKPVEDAILRAQSRGVNVRIAMNSAQAQGDNPSTRLRDAGVPVQFVAGKDVGSFQGLQHAKFVIVDDVTVAMGSNNFSSTGFSVNDENTIVLTSAADDPIIAGFNCYFDRMVARALAEGADCSNADARFTPSTHPWKMIRDELRAAQHSVDVLMHHLVFEDAVKELAKAAERGVRVRVVVNEVDRAETEGSNWDRLRAAGGQVRYKRTNPALYQFMHDKLAIIDGERLLNGSGNWSGSAFFNNWEFFVRLDDGAVVDAFEAEYARLWDWSLTAASLDAGIDARGQDFANRRAYFGNLHAHFHALQDGRLLDDGKLEREVDGQLVDVSAEADGSPMRHAFEYARDRGRLDFLALSPHVQDDRDDDPAHMANMTPAAYTQLISIAAAVTDESSGSFVALPSFEWSTNSAGNHVNVLGARELSKVERGDFATFYEGYLPLRRQSGDRAFMMLNHPRTFRTFDSLNGNWDQLFGVNLQEITSAADRSQKFNDFGLDDFEPLRSARASWIAGEVLPDEAVVQQTLQHIARVTAPHHRLMEVTVGRGTDLRSEIAQNPSLSTNAETGEVERYVKVHRDYDYYLSHGWRLAPAANHDNHAANWGTGHTSRTAILAESLTESGLLDAIDARAVFASEDENLEVWLYADNRVRAGSELRTIADSVALQLYLRDPDYAGTFRVTVWGGTVGGTTEPGDVVELTADTWHTLEVDVNPGEHFFYVEVFEEAPNRMAWSAPVFVVRE